MKQSLGARPLLVLASLFTFLGCGGATAPTPTQNAGTSTTANGASSSDGGTTGTSSNSVTALRCAPSAAQLDACAGVAAGGSCSLFGHQDAGWTWPGTCRPTLDGTAVACAPNPRAPLSALVNACSGKAAGAACQAEGKRGGSFAGSCLTAPDGTTLFCGRVRPRQLAAVEACSGKTAGEACTRPEAWDAGTKAGVCGLGPADAGPLACRPAESPGVAACQGLDAGASCTFGFWHRDWGDGPVGSCVLPASGSPATCLVPCADLRHFHGKGTHGGWGGNGWGQ